jgi:hypothetical protein
MHNTALNPGLRCEASGKNPNTNNTMMTGLSFSLSTHSKALLDHPELQPLEGVLCIV